MGSTSIGPKPTTYSEMSGSMTVSVTVTVRRPPLSPTLWTPGLVNVHWARPVVKPSLVGRTVTFTEALAVPNASVTVIWKVRTGGVSLSATAGEANSGVIVSLSKSSTSGPPVCVHWIIGQPALGSWVMLLQSVTKALGPTTKSGPAVTSGLAPSTVQVTCGGTGLPGHGLSWPTMGPEPKSGPEPWARKGRSWKLFAMFGCPN